jgi:hypothetical protein
MPDGYERSYRTPISPATSSTASVALANEATKIGHRAKLYEA